MPPDTRWIQRYSNFERTFLLLSEAMRVENPSVLERAGLICNGSKLWPLKVPLRCLLIRMADFKEQILSQHVGDQL